MSSDTNCKTDKYEIKCKRTGGRKGRIICYKIFRDGTVKTISLDEAKKLCSQYFEPKEFDYRKKDESTESPPPSESGEYDIVFLWNNEPVFCPPANKTFNLTGTWDKVVLHVELEKKWRLDKVTVNGQSWVVDKNIVEIDITDVVRNGENSFRMDYSGAVMCQFGDRANAYVYLKVYGGKIIKTPTLNDLLGKIEGMGWKVLIVLIVLAVILIALMFLLPKIPKNFLSRIFK